MRNRIFQKVFWEKTIVTAFFLLLATLFAQAQNITVKGRVTNRSGQGIPSASVTIKGTSTGVTTSEDGSFQISAPSNATLVISSVNFTPIEVKVNGRNIVNVELSIASAAMEQVVVIGYGTQKRQNVTTSVASIQGDALRQVAVGNVTQALQGRLPGVVMTQTNSQPGQSMQIRIRGTRSLSATNDPLVILDGIPFPAGLSNINPDDIKSIDILKDASATAIYGSRGANGVIMITTNKGTTGQPARITYNGYQGIETLFHRYPMMTGDELYKLRGIAGKYTTVDASGNIIPQLGADEVAGQNTDWQDLMYKNGALINHSIGVTGGTEKTTYSFNAGYYKQTALTPLQDYTRYSLRGVIEQKVGNYIQLGFTTNDNYGIIDGQNLGLVNVLLLSPLINPYNADGSWKVRGSDPNNLNQWLYSRNSYENLGDGYADKQKTFGSYNSIYGIVKIPGIEGLSYRINLGLNYWTLDRGQYRGVGVLNSAATAQSSGSVQQQGNNNWTVENILTYDKRFNKHHLNLTGLYSGEHTQSTQTLVSATNILADFFQYHNLGQVANSATDIVVNPSDQYLQEYGLNSWMGRVMYDYDNRYMLSAAYRGDGSSRLAPGHQWHNYPAISAGWNITNEQFMNSVAWASQLKLRVGWGQTSNQAINPYQTKGQLATQPYNFGSTTETGYYVSLAPNPDLGWEYSKTWNFGLDFGFFHNRLSGSVDYYLVNTSDILYTVPLPTTAGVGSVTQNIGSTQNKGLEFALNGTIINNRNGWTWDAGVNFAANKNKITSLASGVTEDVSNFWFVGHPINVIYDFQKIGIWQQNDPYLSVLEPGGNVGMIKVKYTGDYNADGTPARQINSGAGHEDRQIMKVDPDWQGGFNTRVAYKNIDLTVIGIYQHGGLLISSLYNSAGYLNNLTGQRGNVKVNYWTPSNITGDFPMPGGVQSGDGPKYGSTLGYFSGSYFKVSTITLGYSFNRENWFKNLGWSVQNARLYFSVQNAFAFSPYTKLSGQDPQPNSLGNQNIATSNLSNVGRSTVLPIVGANAPSVRTFLVGVSLSF
ncbi:MAG TPA: TonB-dependent receptor [Puia sp.]|nr:TonB-dependent receptor [Puia sp.]